MSPHAGHPIALLRAFAVTAAFVLATGGVITAQGSVRVVNPSSGHAFPDIQSAVDAAAEGDTILVRDGYYTEATIDGKGLFLVFDEGAVVNIEQLMVRGLAANQTVSVSGLSSLFAVDFDHRAVVTVESCEGAVLFQDCTVDWTGMTGVALFSSISPEPQVLVRDCAGVAFVRCTLVGLLVDDYASLTSGETSPALHAERSNVSLHACDLRGADGYDGFNAMTVVTGSTPGSAAVTLDDSTLVASGSTLVGGQGGDWEAAFFGPCIPAADGGPGLEVVGAPSSIRLLDTTLAGGAAGVLGGSCPPAPSPGAPLVPAGTPVITLPGPARPCTATAVARESDTLMATVTGEPGDQAWALFGLEPSWAYLAGFTGALLVPPPFVAVRFVGLVPPSGELDLATPAPMLAPGVDVVHVMIQPVLVGATQRLGDGGLTVVLDDAF